MGGSEIFGDDEIPMSNFRFLPEILGGVDFAPYEQNPPPQMAAARKLRRA